MPCSSFILVAHVRAHMFCMCFTMFRMGLCVQVCANYVLHVLGICLKSLTYVWHFSFLIGFHILYPGVYMS